MKKKTHSTISRLPVVCSKTIIQNENEAILKGFLLVNKLPIIYSYLIEMLLMKTLLEYMISLKYYNICT